MLRKEETQGKEDKSLFDWKLRTKFNSPSYYPEEFVT